MKNRGMRQYRFKDNPLEKAFAIEWERLNTSPSDGKINGKGILDYLLAKEINNPKGEVSFRDREVAATVVQWLGSPVGQGFLKDVLKK